MNYEGPGIYQHYKGGIYDVLGLGVREETVIKPHDRPVDEEHQNPTIVVIYKPLTPGSMLGRGEFHGVDFWERTLEDFDAQVDLVGQIDVPLKVVPGQPPLTDERPLPVPRFKMLAAKP
jgi:hypothetical protein